MWLSHREKRLSHSARVLRLIRKKNKWGCPNYMLASPEVGGLAWHRRITDLRKEGHNIKGYNQGHGVWIYYLIEDK